MSDAPNEFEEELRLLRPPEVSPALRRRVARRLAEDEAVSAISSVRWRLWAGGALAAACLLIAVLVWRVSLVGEGSGRPPVVPPITHQTEERPRPTLKPPVAATSR